MRHLLWVLVAMASLAQGQSFTNGSFEQPDVATNTWLYTPTAPGWTFTVYAGIGDGTSVGPGAHTGSQYGLIRDAGSPSTMSQTISGFVVGKQYRVKFWLAKWVDTGGCAVLLTWNGGSDNLVEPSWPPSSKWLPMASRWFTATQTSYQFTFQTKGQAASNGTLVDDFEIEEGGPATPFALINGSAETPALQDKEYVGSPNYALGVGWHFSSQSTGIGNGRVNPYNEFPPDGKQFFFIDRHQFISQPIGDLQAGQLYYIATGARPSDGDRTGGAMSFTLDSTNLWTLPALAVPQFKYYASPPWVAPAAGGLFKATAEYDYPDLSRLLDDIWYARCEPVRMQTFAVTYGKVVSGGIENIRQTDSSYLVVGSAPAKTQFGTCIQFEGTFQVPYSASRYLYFTHTGHISNDYFVMDMELYDFTQSKWVKVGRERYLLSDQTLPFSVVKTATPYIDPAQGNVRVRGTLSKFAKSPSPTTLSLDSILMWSEVH